MACLVIGLHMDANGRNAFPSVQTLATLCSRHRGTVFRWMNEAEDAGFLMRIRRYNASSIYRPAFPPGQSQEQDTTYPEDRVAQCDGVVSNVRRSGSQNAHTTSSLTSPPTCAGASASLPDGSQPLRRDGSWVCPKCGVQVIKTRGTCGYCGHWWADPPPTPERQRRASQRGVDSNVVVDLGSIRKAGSRRGRMGGAQ